MTPYEVWTGRKPNIEHLHTFGCTTFVHILKKKHSKLDSKTIKGLFLGYSDTSKAYRIYNTTSKRLIISRDVIFYEEKNEPQDTTTNLQEDLEDSTFKEPKIEEQQKDQETIKETLEQKENIPVRRSQRRSKLSSK